LVVDGFFDAGMLNLALKANQEAEEQKPSEKVMARRVAGKKLRLNL
jgi:hypothetical protein